jgi:hypothetical protein
MSRGGHQDGRWYARAARHKRQNPICLGCWAAFRRAVPATVSDHVIPVTAQGGSLLAGELQPACRRCHSTTKRELERRFALGQCQPSDLRLDSEMAKQIARRQRGMMHYGLDGRPLDDPLVEHGPLPALLPEPVQRVTSDDEAEAAAPEPARSIETLGGLTGPATKPD